MQRFLTRVMTEKNPNREISYTILPNVEDKIADMLYENIRDSIFADEVLEYLNEAINGLAERNGPQYEELVAEIKSYFTSSPAFQSGELGEVLCKLCFVQLEGKTIYDEKSWGLRDNPKLAKRGIDVIAFKFFADEARDEIYVTETKTAATAENIEKAIYADGGIIDWLGSKMTTGVLSREVNKVLNSMPKTDENRKRISKLLLEYNKPGKLKRTAFLVVSPNLVGEKHKSSIFALAQEGQEVYLYILTSDKYNVIRKMVFERFEVKEDGSSL